ncbi:MAG: hypothetical protein Q7K39_04190 [Candidatus Magasanikbacteria bacterium]|nr:hypothetical protein [Candidatus Magasanikbacteria bacterium]
MKIMAENWKHAAIALAALFTLFAGATANAEDGDQSVFYAAATPPLPAPAPTTIAVPLTEAERATLAECRQIEAKRPARPRKALKSAPKMSDDCRKIWAAAQKAFGNGRFGEALRLFHKGMEECGQPAWRFNAGATHKALTRYVGCNPQNIAEARREVAEYIAAATEDEQTRRLLREIDAFEKSCQAADAEPPERKPAPVADAQPTGSGPPPACPPTQVVCPTVPPCPSCPNCELTCPPMQVNCPTGALPTAPPPPAPSQEPQPPPLPPVQERRVVPLPESDDPPPVPARRAKPPCQKCPPPGPFQDGDSIVGKARGFERAGRALKEKWDARATRLETKAAAAEAAAAQP